MLHSIKVYVTKKSYFCISVISVTSLDCGQDNESDNNYEDPTQEEEEDNAEIDEDNYEMSSSTDTKQPQHQSTEKPHKDWDDTGNRKQPRKQHNVNVETLQRDRIEFSVRLQWV